jgi:hypothetical protein
MIVFYLSDFFGFVTLEPGLGGGGGCIGLLYFCPGEYPLV